MIQIKTSRLILRNFQPGDEHDYFAYMHLPYTALHEDFEPLTLAECEKFVRERLSRDDFWAVELAQTHTLIGDLCYRAQAFDTYEIAYDFNVAYEKKGFATEACEALVCHIFTSLKARRIVASCNVGNENSWRLLSRLHFRREGHMLEDVSLKKDVAGNPIYVDSYYYALLRREWELAAEC